MPLIRHLLLAAALFLAAAVPGPARAQSGGELELLRLSLMEGDVQLRIPEADDWVAAAVNTPLRAGDRLWLPAGARAELQLRDGSRVRLNEGTALELLRLEPGATQFYLSRGQAFVNFRGRPGELLQLDTPPGALRVTELAVFRVDVRERGEVDLGVFAGRVRADGARERRVVGAGDRLILRTDGGMMLAGLGPTDEWERWNHARDRELSEYRASTRYLPEELEPYAWDFDRYGRWVSVADYGWVWTPQIVVSVGWAPYSHGRWVWIGGDYVWISYDPWGWVPHHYGRWVFAAGFGWCWVPPRRGAVFWAPGWVGWVHSGPQVAWVPLAPNEIYHGYGHYGPHSVNLFQLDVRTTVIRPDYRNARVAGAVIAVTRDDFIRGRTTAARLEVNPFLRGEIRPGRPDIAPASASYAPRLHAIPRTAQPPESVRNIEVRRLQDSRPLVKESPGPVFRGTPAPERRAIEPRSPAAPRVQTPPIEAPRNGRAPAAPTERRIEAAPREPRPSQPAPVERRIETAPREFRSPSAPPAAAPERRPETAPLLRPEPSPRTREIERRRETPPESRLPRPRETVVRSRDPDLSPGVAPRAAQSAPPAPSAASAARRAAAPPPSRPEERAEGRAPAEIRRGREQYN